ncbi:MAG TPA: M20/M25/M40 family metallo-hydrolase, partial [Isosphaeraceae bacterium]|nr:M20/M25/M40 family metallo-hydrolase [Isosphaeraceae bacterium]
GRLAVANLGLLGPLVARGLASSESTNALIRTTAAVTLVRGGTKDNVLPGSATAIVNFRLLPGDTSAGLLDHVTRAVADPAVKVRFADPARYSQVFEASHVSPTDSQAYARLRRAIRQTFPDAVVVPYVTVGGTDARRYEGLTRHVYRFLPVRLVGDDLKRIHGRYERISLKNYGEAVRFYANLIRQFD